VEYCLQPFGRCIWVCVIDILLLLGLVYLQDCDIFPQDEIETQYSNIPLLSAFGG